MHLVIVTPGPVPSTPDRHRVEISDKFISGVLEYAKSWPGDITVAAEPSTGADTNIGSGWRDVDQLPFSLRLSEDVPDLVRLLRADVALVGLTDRSLGIRSVLERVVVVAELPLTEHLRVAWAERTGAVGFTRHALGLVRRERALLSLIREAAGVQCNGHPAYSAFSSLNRRAMLFYDTRLTAADMSTWQTTGPRDGPLRLGFSGLYERHKGPEYAVRLGDSFAATRPGSTLTMVGGGTRIAELSDLAGDAVEVRDALPFRPDWLSFVSTNIDLMVLPHVQGDPAGTYLETAGLGVPVLGFDNAALAALEQFGFAWTVKMRDECALLRAVTELDLDRERVRQAGEMGRTFMREHTFEKEFERRVEHLVTIAQR